MRHWRTTQVLYRSWLWNFTIDQGKRQPPHTLANVSGWQMRQRACLTMSGMSRVSLGFRTTWR